MGDIRESPAIDLVRLLADRGGKILYHDPHVPEFHSGSASDHLPNRYVSQELTAELVRNVDCVAIMTDHSNIDYNWLVKYAHVVVDARNATKLVENHRDKIIRI